MTYFCLFFCIFITQIAAQKFGFVSGVHGSGTSILHYSLSKHADISIINHANGGFMDEGQHATKVLMMDRYLARLATTRAKINIREYPERLMILDKSMRYVPMLSDERKEKLREDWMKVWTNVSKPWLIEKSPTDLLQMPLLEDAFPPAFFALILRHPLKVCERFSAEKRYYCVLNWCNAYELAFEDMVKLRAKPFITFYEIWVDDPVREMVSLSNDWGLEEKDWAAIFRFKEEPEILNTRQGYRINKEEKKLKEFIFVDALSDSIPKYSQPDLLDFEERVNAFGYSMSPPFFIDCDIGMRRLGACLLPEPTCSSSTQIQLKNGERHDFSAITPADLTHCRWYLDNVDGGGIKIVIFDYPFVDVKEGTEMLTFTDYSGFDVEFHANNTMVQTKQSSALLSFTTEFPNNGFRFYGAIYGIQ